MKRHVKRRIARNADDKIRRLERLSFQTQETADILAYWRACLKAGIDPKPNDVLPNTTTNFPRGWLTSPKKAYSTTPELLQSKAGGFYLFDDTHAGGWRIVPTLQVGLQEILDSMGNRENPPFAIKYTERPYTKSPAGLWRGEVRFYAFAPGSKRPRRVGKLFLNLGNIEVAGQPAATVLWIGVEDAYRRQGIATALYKAAAELSCARGYILASDVQLRAGSEGFWKKQKAAGNAALVREVYGDKVRLRYILTCPASVL